MQVQNIYISESSHFPFWIFSTQLSISSLISCGQEFDKKLQLRRYPDVNKGLPTAPALYSQFLGVPIQQWLYIKTGENLIFQFCPQKKRPFYFWLDIEKEHDHTEEMTCTRGNMYFGLILWLFDCSKEPDHCIWSFLLLPSLVFLHSFSYFIPFQILPFTVSPSMFFLTVNNSSFPPFHFRLLSRFKS